VTYEARPHVKIYKGRPHLTLADAISKADEAHRVKHYVEAYLATGVDKEFSTKGDAYNISVVTLDRDFDSFVKKSTLIASQLAICHDSRMGESLLFSERRRRHYNQYYIGRDIADLGRLLLDVEPLIRTGKVLYIPDVYARLEATVSLAKLRVGDPQTGLNSPKTAFDLMLKGGRLTQLASDMSLGPRLAIPLMRLQVPVLDDVSLRDYSKIVVEESEAYAGFSDYLRSRLLDLDGEDNEVNLTRDAAKLGLELRAGLRESRAELERLTRRNAVQATGATVAFFAATLVAVAGPARLMRK
jgi:hypothetical protein